jgi:hypothetical protein
MPHNEVIAVQVRHIADLVCLFIFSSFYTLISSSFYAFHLDWFFHLSSVFFLFYFLSERFVDLIPQIWNSGTDGGADRGWANGVRSNFLE